MSNDTYKLSAGGVEWTLGKPGTEESVTVTIHGQNWTMPATKATGAKGTFWIVHYERWAWRPGHRPFEKDCWLGLDAKHKLLVRAALLDTVLWSLGTGRDPNELPDCWTTATMVTDQPTPRASSPQAPAQAQRHEQPEVASEPQRPREGARQRLGRLMDALRQAGDKP